ncbi:MAG: UvrD-helicase domain-containing protein [Chloroflexi bacterium]|nr:UvrD-helicase domain-containing protein [Chloroflexota bacterium]
MSLNTSQVNAAITREACTLVLAGPGTGKTATVLAKLAHLCGRRKTPAAEILILSYNRNSTEEVIGRAGKAGLRADVRTFHALGRGVLGEGGGQFKVSKMAEDRARLRVAIQGFLRAALADPNTAARVEPALHSGLLPYRNLFMFKSKDEYYRYVRSVELRALSGDLVKSLQELEIANFLYCNSVDFRYEEQFPFKPGGSDRPRYLPDFFLPDYGIYLEHFAIHRDGSTPPFIDRRKYTEAMKWKRVVHREHGTTLLETYSYQKHEGTLLSDLEATLRANGVGLRPIGPEKLWARLEELNYTTRLTALLGTFLGHFKSNEFDLAALRVKAAKHPDPERCIAFLALFEVVYQMYQQALREEAAIDFEDMIVGARGRVEEGSYRSPYRFILVDEFQDISAGRARFLKALADQRDAELFLVGDDWQSIYRFAGSDPQIMIDCESHFGPTTRTALDRSYRLNSSVLSVSTAFVTKNPDQIKKAMRPVKAVPEPRVSIWYARDEGALLGPLAAISKEWTSGGRPTVLVLGRYRHLRPQDWDRLSADFDDLALSFMTVHRAKGLEADYVVLLGLSAGAYGFPAEIADDPILDLVLPANERFEHAEERRLFYVALTRAKEHVHLIADPERPSVFVEELKAGEAVSVIGEQPPAPNCPGCGAGVVKRRSNPRTGVEFFSCSNDRLCDWRSLPCDTCEDGYIDAERHCSNDGCSTRYDLCPECGDGALMPRRSRYGPYFVCSRRREIPPCGYKRDGAAAPTARPR